MLLRICEMRESCIHLSWPFEFVGISIDVIEFQSTSFFLYIYALPGSYNFSVMLLYKHVSSLILEKSTGLWQGSSLDTNVSYFFT